MRFWATVVSLVLGVATSVATHYEPNWASLDTRPTPDWWQDAKFGIKIHWGPYSVPSWADKNNAKFGYRYAECYVYYYAVNGTPTYEFHQRCYGDRKYDDFAPDFRAELYDPAEWAALFKAAGAKYVYMTVKHGDGFFLYPTKTKPYWNSVAVGAHRDLYGDLMKAVREAGLSPGAFVEMAEAENPDCPEQTDSAGNMHWNCTEGTDASDRYVSYIHQQLREVVEWYQPRHLYVDGDWVGSSSFFRAPEFLAWLFNDSPVKDEVAINDRWGKECPGHHGGYYLNCAGFDPLSSDFNHPWAQTFGFGSSFGYNRIENATDYKSTALMVLFSLLPVIGGFPIAFAQLWWLVRTVAMGGNLELNVGPTHDGRIDNVMQDRLRAIGDWLGPCGDCIYGTRRWSRGFWENVTSVAGSATVYYTREGGSNDVFAIVPFYPVGSLSLVLPHPTNATTVTLVGHDVGSIKWEPKAGGGIVFHAPSLPLNGLPFDPPYAFRLKDAV